MSIVFQATLSVLGSVVINWRGLGKYAPSPLVYLRGKSKRRRTILSPPYKHLSNIRNSSPHEVDNFPPYVIKCKWCPSLHGVDSSWTEDNWETERPHRKSKESAKKEQRKGLKRREECLIRRQWGDDKRRIWVWMKSLLATKKLLRRHLDLDEVASGDNESARKSS